jgi:hypothetical protein
MPKNLVICPMVESKNLNVINKLIAKSPQKTMISPLRFYLKSKPIIKIVPIIEGIIYGWKYYSLI